MKNEYAFPHGQCTAFESGMTLRDYFAGQALAGYCVIAGHPDKTPINMATSAYVVADAMLKARGAE